MIRPNRPEQDQPTDNAALKISTIAAIQAKFIKQTVRKIRTIEKDIKSLYHLFNLHGGK